MIIGKETEQIEFKLSTGEKNEAKKEAPEEVKDEKGPESEKKVTPKKLSKK